MISYLLLEHGVRPVNIQFVLLKKSNIDLIFYVLCNANIKMPVTFL